MQTRSGKSSNFRVSTCSSTISISSSSPQKEASVANPSGGNKEYFIGLQYGLLASSSAGKINLIFTLITPYTNLFITILGCKNYFLIF